MIKVTGLNNAVIGECYDKVTSKRRLVYDIDKCITLLMQNLDSDYEDAADYFWYNVADAYIGDDTPIFVEKYTKEDIEDL